MAEPNMIYKIAALEMLDKAGEPLSNMQITGFFLFCGFDGLCHGTSLLCEGASILLQYVL